MIELQLRVQVLQLPCTCQQEVLHAGHCVRPNLSDAHIVAGQAAAQARLNQLVGAALSLQARSAGKTCENSRS